MFTNITNITNNPSLITNYEIINNLGGGEHGKVHKVRYKIDNKIYAMKMIPQNSFLKKNGEKDNEKEADYLRETTILYQLNNFNNPKIIKLHAVFQDIYYRYIVTEFVEGKDLSKLRQEYSKNNEYIKQRIIIKILKQLLEVLIFLHDECKIMHRDIKPENIMIDKDYNIKLIDFGLAVYLENPNPNLVSRKSFKGSKIYVPPEILYSKYRNYDYKVDIFCLGFTMFNIMNPDDINGNTNLPQFTDKKLQRKVNSENYNDFYDDWLMDLIKTFYSINPLSRPTAKYAYQFLLNNEHQKRRDLPNLLIRRALSQPINVISNVSLVNKNLKKMNTIIEQHSLDEFLLPNEGKENKIITSMKSLIRLLSKLEDMNFIKAQFHSIFNNHSDKDPFLKSYYNIFKELDSMDNHLLDKKDYDVKINEFITETFLKNESQTSGPRPIILFFMITSIINKEFSILSPEYKNTIFDNELENSKYPLDIIIPIQEYEAIHDSVLEKIKNFKKNKRSSFIDFFYFLGLDIVKCPQCDFILNVETYQCELLQIELINDKNTISELVEEYFALKYEEEKYECKNCESIELITKQFYCLNAPKYLILELEDKNKIIFSDEILIPLYKGESISYRFVGGIYLKKVVNHSEFYAVIKEKEKIILYDNDKVTESSDMDLMNSENPSMVIYQKNN